MFPSGIIYGVRASAARHAKTEKALVGNCKILPGDRERPEAFFVCTSHPSWRPQSTQLMAKMTPSAPVVQ